MIVLPRVLSIAGSDSGAGAGIQADLKAFAACGVHGMTAITAITAQNTIGVTAIHPIPPEIIIAQVQAVADDIGVDAVKIGMLGDRATIEAVAEALTYLPEGTPVVLDPVMVAESGAVLLAPEARQALIENLLPRAAVLTPNVPEARTLVGDADGDLDIDDPGATRSRARTAGRRRHRRPPRTADRRVLRRRAGWSSSTARATRTVPPTARAAPTPRCSPRVSPTATSRSRPRARPASSPLARWRRDSARSAPGPARSTSWGLPANQTFGQFWPVKRPREPTRFWHNPSVRFLRMKPGHGEVLIAEGDVERAEDEQRLIEEFRRQLDAGLWAAVPVSGREGKRESIMVRSFEDIPWDADRVIFFPRAAGGR